MCLDQCIAYGETQEQVRRAMDRTHRWAGQCLQTHRESGAYRKQALFGIVQGGTFPELREESTGFITGLEFDGLEFNGYAIGGLAVGENKEQMYATTGQVAAKSAGGQAAIPDGRRFPGGPGGVGGERGGHVRLRSADPGGSQWRVVHALGPRSMLRSGGLPTSQGRWRRAATAMPASGFRRATSGTCSAPGRCWGRGWPASTTCASSTA